MSETDAMVLPEPIPVTVVTGFLGSGKTTLINRLLHELHIGRVAIIENEFGSVGIDATLLQQEHSAQMTVVELSNGCICCSIQGELSDALLQLWQQRANAEIAFERIVIESTGLADPTLIAQMFFTQAQLRERYQLDGVLTVVDAIHAMQQLDEHPVAVAQVAFADVLLLSKTSAVAQTAYDELVMRLRQINAKASLHDMAQFDDWSALFNQNGFYLDERILPLTAQYQTLHSLHSAQAQTQTQTQTHGPLLTAHRSWADNIGSVVLRHDAPMDLARVGQFVETLVEQFGHDLLRYKGILAIADEPRRLIFQGVHKVVGYDYGREWQADESASSVMVLIGRGLDEAKLSAQLAACIAES